MATTPGRPERPTRFASLFETDCEVYFVFNGTAANSLALASLCQSYHSVICCDQAHVETDECGAPEFFSNGSKLLVAASAHGQADARCHSRAGDQAPGHSLSQAARGHHHAVDRDWPRVHARRAWRDRGTMPGAWAFAAHGWRALCQCLRQPGLLARGDDLEARRRCAVLWRREKWYGNRRSGAVFRSRAGHRFRLPLQAGRATGLEDALSVGALGGNARERRVAAQRRARQPVRAAVCGPDRWNSRRHDCAAC